MEKNILEKNILEKNILEIINEKNYDKILPSKKTLDERKIIFDQLCEKKYCDDDFVVCVKGIMYENGYGTNRNYNLAKEMHENAIIMNKNNTTAMCRLAGMYKEGIGFIHTNALKELLGTSEKFGVRRDYKKALDLYTIAAELGDGSATNAIGNMYENGVRGVKKNYATAKKFYEKAYELGDTTAMENLAYMNKNGLGIKKNFIEAKRIYGEVRRKYERSIREGDVSAYHNLGLMYQNGIGMKKDYKESKKIYEDGIEAGSIACIGDLAELYYNGDGVAEDYVKVRELYEKLIEYDDCSAMNNLADLYDRGLGVEKDRKKAVTLFEKSVKCGGIYALLNLGKYYCSDESTNDQDYGKAVEFYIEYYEKSLDSDVFFNILSAFQKADDTKSIQILHNESILQYITSEKNDIVDIIMSFINSYVTKNFDANYVTKHFKIMDSKNLVRLNTLISEKGKNNLINIECCVCLEENVPAVYNCRCQKINMCAKCYISPNISKCPLCRKVL